MQAGVYWNDEGNGLRIHDDGCACRWKQNDDDDESPKGSVGKCMDTRAARVGRRGCMSDMGRVE